MRRRRRRPPNDLWCTCRGVVLTDKLGGTKVLECSLVMIAIFLFSVLILSLFIGLVSLAGCIGTVEELNLNRSDSRISNWIMLCRGRASLSLAVLLQLPHYPYCPQSSSSHRPQENEVELNSRVVIQLHFCATQCTAERYAKRYAQIL